MDPHILLQGKLLKAEAEIADLEKLLASRRAYAEGLRDALNLVSATKGGLEPGAFRAGSDMEKVRRFLVKSGRPMPTKEIAKGIGKGGDPHAIKSLGASLSGYFKRGKFTRPKRGFFGLPTMPVTHDQNGASLFDQNQ